MSYKRLQYTSGEKIINSTNSHIVNISCSKLVAQSTVQRNTALQFFTGEFRQEFQSKLVSDLVYLNKTPRSLDFFQSKSAVLKFYCRVRVIGFHNIAIRLHVMFSRFSSFISFIQFISLGLRTLESISLCLKVIIALYNYYFVVN